MTAMLAVQRRLAIVALQGLRNDCTQVFSDVGDTGIPPLSQCLIQVRPLWHSAWQHNTVRCSTVREHHCGWSMHFVQFVVLVRRKQRRGSLMWCTKGSAWCAQPLLRKSASIRA